MNNKDWYAIELLGPPPPGEHWFPAGRWECRKGHIEIGGIKEGVGVKTKCAKCGKTQELISKAWIQGEPPLVTHRNR